ncbi:MAG TPA: CIA30 family protein [Verrucomicrobiales bacterium]|nr:CIA30 family protein [Verrucomicrobiales bacterium]
MFGLKAAQGAEPGQMITDFNPADRALIWQIVNDDVMGGVSTSRIEVGKDGIARFSGKLSLENNGGFASVRSAGRLPDLAGHTMLVVRVKGDGRTYQLRLRMGTGGRAPDYRAEFPTKKGEWQEHRLALADFVPTWRGQMLDGLPPVDPARIQSIGFLLADKQPGAFALEIDWIRAESGETGSAGS